MRAIPNPLVLWARGRFQPGKSIPCLQKAGRSILELIETIDTPPLHRMLWRIFREREVVARFWTMPASARHHHAFPGGLAIHSLEWTTQSFIDTHRPLCA